MQLQVFSIFDSKAGCFMQPFFSLSKGVALRSFMAAAEDASHDFSKYPEDFTLFHLGNFDQVAGQFTQFDAPENLGNALALNSRPLQVAEGIS